MSNKLRRDCLESRGRSTLLWCATVLLLSPLPGGWLIDHCPLHIRFPAAATTIALWEKATPQPDLLILGSSRLGSFIRTANLSVTSKESGGKEPPVIFNSTIPGGEPVTLQFLTSRLLAARAGSPRFVLLEINADLLARDNLYFRGIVTQVMTSSDILKYAGDILLYNDGLPRLVSSRLTPFFRHRAEFLTWADETFSWKLTQAKVPDDKSLQQLNDWRAAANDRPDMLPEERLRLALRRFETHLRHYQLAGATASAFEQTVAMLYQRHCAIVLVQPPLSSAHRAFLSPTIRSQFEAFLRRLHDSYGTEFFDYSDKLSDTFFADNHHANAVGSSKFTELLAHEVVAPTWRKLNAKPENNNQAALH
jgi:hypothetical protein